MITYCDALGIFVMLYWYYQLPASHFCVSSVRCFVTLCYIRLCLLKVIISYLFPRSKCYSVAPSSAVSSPLGIPSVPSSVSTNRTRALNTCSGDMGYGLPGNTAQATRHQHQPSDTLLINNYSCLVQKHHSASVTWVLDECTSVTWTIYISDWTSLHISVHQTSLHQ